MSEPMALYDDWCEEARTVLEELAGAGAPFTADDLRDRLRPAPHRNLPGSVFRCAAAAGTITELDTVRSKVRSRKHSKITRWIGTQFAQEEA